MRTYLVLAHKTLLGGPLLEALRERAARAPSRFHLVVPMEVPSGATWTEGQVRRAAEERLAAGLEQLGAAGLEVTGEVGDGRPVDAVQQVLLRGDLSIDEIIVSTLPPGPSRWLKWDVPHRVATVAAPIPVHHVVGEPARQRARAGSSS